MNVHTMVKILLNVAQCMKCIFSVLHIFLFILLFYFVTCSSFLFPFNLSVNCSFVKLLEMTVAPSSQPQRNA